MYLDKSITDIDYSKLTENELFKLCSGDRFAEEELASRYSKKVRIIARKFFLFGGDNEDLIQEGMIGLLSAIRTYNSNSSAQFSTYAERCIKNRIIDSIHFSGNAFFESIEDSLSEQFVEKCFYKSPEDLFIESENYLEWLDSLKVKLSSFEFSVLEAFLKGDSYADIAALNDKSLGSIYNAMQRIRIKLS